MMVYVNESGSDRAELLEALVRDGVTYRECPTESFRELGKGCWRVMEVRADLPEIILLPAGNDFLGLALKAWRLPSGRVVIAGANGSLEQVTLPWAPPLT